MTIEELRVALHINEDDDSYDASILDLYALSKKIFEQYTRVCIDPSTTTDTKVNFLGSAVYLYKTPVNTINEILVDGEEYQGNYRLYYGAIYFDEIVNCKFLDISYDTGYTTIPTEIDKLLAQITDFLFNYDANKVYMASTSAIPLSPEDVNLPKVLQDSLAIYRVGI